MNKAARKKVITVVGARPQFIKAAVVSRAISRHSDLQELIIHTGQHYDEKMSDVFFRELGIPAPAHSLSVGSGPHGQQTGRMLEAIEKVLQDERPSAVMVYGDTNSTLAGALAATKLHIPLVHVEAGLRSFNMKMPEEINRIVTDRISDVLCCPTRTAMEHLRNEGLGKLAHLTGDVMYDCTLEQGERARRESRALEQCGVQEKSYALATIHRPENTDDPVRLARVFETLGRASERLPVVLPLHPRTRAALAKLGVVPPKRLQLIEPVSFLDMTRLEQGARVILTDSGGVQKEAFFHGVPCVTLRDQTEWVETIDCGWNALVGSDPVKTLAAMDAFLAHPPDAGRRPTPYGDGDASQKIVALLKLIHQPV